MNDWGFEIWIVAWHEHVTRCRNMFQSLACGDPNRWFSATWTTELHTLHGLSSSNWPPVKSYTLKLRRKKGTQGVKKGTMDLGFLLWHMASVAKVLHIHENELVPLFVFSDCLFFFFLFFFFPSFLYNQ